MNNSEFQLNIAVVIGINDYQNGIPVLGTARQDAVAIAKILQAEYQYRVFLITDRSTIAATYQNLITWLETELPQQLKASSPSRLLFYFAGHGIALNGDDGPQGYLIPQDARLGDVSTYIPMPRIEAALTQLSCRHCLVILDCCFAGAFRWSSTRRLIPVSKVIHKERFDRFIQDPAWQVITSAASDQYALDSLDLNSDRGVAKQNQQHSPFAAALMAALRGAADVYPPASGGKRAGDGIITATELYLYLRDAVEAPTDARNHRQTPQIWCLKKHDKGEFIFRPPGHVLNLPSAPALNELEENNPYRGLKPYETQDRDRFFGRTALIEKLVDAIHDRLFTVVLGASGSGKSSLVKAGLIPDLDDDRWQVLGPMRPGELPLSALPGVFKELGLTSTDPINPKSYSATIVNWQRANPTKKLLLVIDQWEELITLCQHDPDRQQLLNLLAELLQAHADVLRVVITLRSDFEAQFRSTPLEPLWRDARFVVPAMSREELRSVIEEPAAAKVVYFESLVDGLRPTGGHRGNLSDQLIDEVSGMPGSLPLLSFTLSELYLKLARRYRAAQTTGETIDRSITWADYDALGGVTKSLTRRADEEYNALVRQDVGCQQTIRQVMLRMVAVGGELARRQVPESELKYPEPENTRVRAVLNRFLSARLLVSGTDANDQPYIEPAHDALVRGWEKLLAWKQEAAESLILQRRLSPAAIEWHNRKSQEVGRRLLDRSSRQPTDSPQKHSPQKSQQFLWNANPYLDVLHDKLKANANWFNQVEREFVQASWRQKQQNRSWRWRIAMGVIAGLSGLTVAALIGQRASLISQIQAFRQSAEADFRSGQQLDAFLDSLRAAQPFKHPLLRLFKPSSQLEAEVQGTMQKAVYAVQEYNRLEGNQGVTKSSVSLDGKLIVSADEDGAVKLWNQQGQIQAKWETKQGRVMNVTFSPDSQKLAIAAGNMVSLWSLKGDRLAEFQGHEAMVKGISFSPDGAEIATSGNDKTIRRWNLKGEPLAVFYGHQDDVWSVAFSPDGNILASAADDGTFRLWNRQGKQLKRFQLNQGELHNIKFSPDGQRLAISGEKGLLLIWSLQGKLLAKLAGHQGRVWNVVFSHDGQQLASAAGDGTVRLWNVQAPALSQPACQPACQPLMVLRGHQGPVRNVSFSPDRERPDRQHLVSSGDDSTVRLWNVAGQQQVSLIGHQGTVRSITFSPKHQQLATSDEDGTIRLWEAPEKLLDTFEGNLGPVRAIAFSPNGTQLASAQGKTVRLWNLSARSSIELMGHQALVRSVQFSPDGQQLVSAGDDATIRLWNSQGQQLVQWQADKVQVWEVAFSPDGQNIASAGGDGIVRLWNLQGEPLGKLEGHLGAVFSVMFSPDGQHLASAGQDSTIRLWDRKTQRKSQLFQVYDADVNSVTFSPDGKFLVSGDERGNVQLWNLGSQQQFAAWNAHLNSIVRKVSVSPDGQQVATAADDGIAKVWQLGTFDQLVTSGCGLMGDYLKLEEHRALTETDRDLCKN
jgi:WD40 repeat protein